MALNGVVWENGRVALTLDLIFGLCVMGEQGWVPCSDLDLDDLKVVHRAVDHNPGCPFKDELDVLVSAAEKEAAEAWGK